MDQAKDVPRGDDRRAGNARGAQQRDRLIAAAIELMADGGEKAVSLAATAKRAGVSRGTVHYHFADRSALLATVRRDLQAQLLRLAGKEHHFSNPYGLALRLAVEDQSIIRSRIHHILEMGPLADGRTRNLLARLAELDAEGALRPGVDPIAAALIASALDFAGMMAIELGGTQAEQRHLTAQLSESWHQIFVHGVLRESGDSADGGAGPDLS